MRIRKQIEKLIQHQKEGVNAAGHIDATVAMNVGEEGSTQRVRSTSTRRIVQRNGKTIVDEGTHEVSHD